MPIIAAAGALSAKALGFNGGPPTPSILVWNPFDAAPQIGFSNSFHTAFKATTGNPEAGVRGYPGRAAGKWQFNVTCDVIGTNMSIGAADSFASLTNFTGLDTHSIGYYPFDGISYNGVSYPGPGGYTAGDRLGVAVDIDNRLAYFNKNNGAWATPVDISPMRSPIFPIAQFFDGATQYTLVFGGNAIKFRQW